MTVASKGKKPAGKKTATATFTRRDTVTDTAKKAKAVKVVDVDMREIERKAAERYQRKHSSNSNIKSSRVSAPAGNECGNERNAFKQAVRTSLHTAANPNPRAFRPLNSRELGKLSAELGKLNPNGGPRIPAHHPLAIWSKRPVGTVGSIVRVSYENMQGGFCVCVLLLIPHSDPGDTLVWRGASRRSYKDKPNDVKGQLQAFERAILFSRAERVPV